MAIASPEVGEITPAIWEKRTVVHSHLGVHDTYTFAMPDLSPGAIRDLRDPNAAEDDLAARRREI
ncbi:hypothetical protein GCM10022224_090580 [Nonomuraea antimicrobica]|uniref:Uncharacterized protein n=1 Tax=Nonomuraea antimicrobica TaxID=561173 RepID=A0ABP7DYN3_9ACTN